MEVPEDIREKATRFAGEYLAHDVSCERLYRDVVALLMAERERCAKIAEGLDRRGREWVQDSLWDNIKRDTARAIRNQP
jgi:hypothetical protein